MNGGKFGTPKKSPERAKEEREARETFSSQSGVQTLGRLERFCLWNDELRGKTEAETHENIGKREVYRYILRLLGRVKKDERTDDAE